MATNRPSVLPPLRFLAWQPAYEAVLQSADTRMLFRLVEVAEAAIMVRRDLLNGDSNHRSECDAIEEALRILRVIKKERLLFPPAPLYKPSNRAF
jgi:hypothetical protein